MSSSDVDSLRRCYEQKKLEYERYYETVLLTLGMKKYLTQKSVGCRFVSSEPTFHGSDDESEVKPDIVIQYDKDLYGILCEIKTSIPSPDPYVKMTLIPQLEKYSKEIRGWDTPLKWVRGHDILVLVHLVDANRLAHLISTWIEKNELQMNRNLCIAEWGVIQSLKFPTQDIILIKHKYGKLNCIGLQNELEKNIQLNVQELSIDYERCQFTRKPPPDCYTMDRLWGYVFTAFTEESEDFEVEMEDVLKVTYEYFIPWSGIEGEFSQVRRTWIRKALDQFCNIGLAERIGQGRYRIFYGKKIPKDRLDYFITRMCRNEIESFRRGLSPDEMQRSLMEYELERA